MTVEQLRAKRRKAERTLKSKQSRREKVRKVADFAKRRGWERLQEVAHSVAKRLSGDIAELHTQIKELTKRIDQAQRSHREEFVAWLHSKVGVVEYSAEHRSWAADLGYSASLPWCSIFAAYGLKHKGGFDGRLPVNPAYSGNWLIWPHGHRVSYAQAQAGDLLVHDWGDGGITDHVSIYVGNGIKVGGNENDRVERDAVPPGTVVGVVRPNW